MSIVGPHKFAYEYDGAFGCTRCKANWGALPGKPVMPETCEINPYQERYDFIKNEIKRLEEEVQLLERLMRIAR